MARWPLEPIEAALGGAISPSAADRLDVQQLDDIGKLEKYVRASAVFAVFLSAGCGRDKSNHLPSTYTV